MFDSIPKPWFDNFVANHKFVYRSPEVGLDNSWDLWMRSDSTAIILIRATTTDPKSRLADFLCSMSASNGSFQLRNGHRFEYKLAEHPDAAVHTGFLLGFAHLAYDMKPKIDSLYNNGVRNFIITGHSQGAALSYLVTSWLFYLKKDKIYPNIALKTYSSAPPKPGNVGYANDFNNSIGHQWAFSIINSEDPIPEIPFTTQQIEEINEPNPLTMLQTSVEKMSFFQRTIISKRFNVNKMKQYAEKSSKSYQKYLGTSIASLLKDIVPNIDIPVTVNSTNYTTPGTPISLLFRDEFSDMLSQEMKENNFSNHNPETYRLLLRQYFDLH